MTRLDFLFLNLSSYKIIVIFGAYLAGVLCMHLNILYGLVLFILGGLVILFWGKRANFILILLVFLIFGLYRLYFEARLPSGEVSNYIDNEVKIQFQIIEVGDGKYIAKCKQLAISNDQENIKDDNAEVLMDSEQGIEHEFEDNKHVLCSGKFLIKSYDDYEYADLVTAEGRIIEINEKSRNYYYFLKVHSELQIDYALGITKSSIFPMSQINKLRIIVLERIRELYPYPESELSAGLIIGKAGNINKEFMDKMNLAGVSHIVVVSGFNISVLILTISALLISFNKKQRFILITISLVIFSLLAGMEMPVVRAGIMGITPLIIAFRGRRVDSLINLLLSAFVILLISPFALFQASFQLSFMATLGVIVLSPFIKDLIKFLGETMSATVATTLSAFIMVIPIIMTSFKTLNLTGLISNIIVLELIPLAYFSSLISLIFPLSFKSVNLFYYISDVLLKFIINASYYFSKFDSLVFDIEIKGYFVLGLYLIVITVLFERYYQNYKRNTKE